MEVIKPRVTYCSSDCYKAFRSNRNLYGRWWKKDNEKMLFYEKHIQFRKKCGATNWL